MQESFERHLGIAPGGDTDPEGQFTIEKVACLGCCTLAPVVQIDGVTYGRLTRSGSHECWTIFSRRPTPAAARADAAAAGPQGRWAKSASGWVRAASPREAARSMKPFARRSAESGARAVVKPVGCVGMCHQTPLVELVPAGGGPAKLFAKVHAESAADIVLSHFGPGRLAADRIPPFRAGSTGC